MSDLSIVCMNVGCGNVKQSRGLCYPCYQRLLHLVQTKKTTWAELEAEGKCLKAAKAGQTKWGRNWNM